MASSSFLITDRYNQLYLPIHPDNLTINQDSGYAIEAVRKVIAQTFQKPFNRNFQIAWISQAQNLSIEAQNTLLKVFEEPSPTTIMIASVSNPELLIATIRSRCEQISLDEFKALQQNPSQHTEWVHLFEIKDPTRVGDLPQLPLTNEQAFDVVEEWATKERGEILALLEAWLEKLAETPVQTFEYMSILLDTKEALAHNAHIELALDVMAVRLVRAGENKLRAHS